MSDVVTSRLSPAAIANDGTDVRHVDVDVGLVGSKATLKDIVALGKPSIALMAAIVGGGAWLLATPSFDPATLMRGALGVLGITLIVMGAGALNMLLERDIDGLMARTRKRPLAAGRMSPLTAGVVGAVFVVASLPLLLIAGNALTAGLGLLSLFLYVLVYTPMKRTSAWSLVVGSVPGAMPALMGATLAANRFEVIGLSLFAVVFLWQLPHFLAISIYRQAEYDGAGHKVFPTTVGVEISKTLVIATTAPLCALGVMLWPLGVGGPVYAFIALLVGAWFTLVSAAGYSSAMTRPQNNAWARRSFLASLVWQTVIFGALGVDRVLFALFQAAP